MSNENTIISRLKLKDESALADLYDKYSAALYGVIVRMCKDEGNAQIILQDTFMTIWEKPHLYDAKKGRFYTWAYRIAKNKTLNFLRKPENLIQVEDLSVYKDKTEDVTNDVDTLKLKGSIQHLDAHHQRAIELVYFNGLTHREAHKEMGVPLGTFKSYVRQALKQLQQSYVKLIVFLMLLIEITK
ncbi:RNA polymerase sigma factor [uncultured Psychroserpens sp.]|uniref:RNA polymerase sigma factor n=1 Tax=uncultured Psychroserpens sp. TaxID=255436 RepID=UPI00260EE1AD|nr:RNA polymerase sigma factor [uncultured Psychroserpens sp.]